MNLIQNQRGQSLIEYMVIFTLISLAGVGLASKMKTQIKDKYNTATDKIQSIKIDGNRESH